MNTRYRVTYFGRDAQTVYLLDQEEKLDLVGVNLIQDFLEHKSLNPANLLFKFTYLLRYKNKFRLLEVMGIKAGKYLKVFSTSIYAKYADYLYFISTKRILLLNLEKPEEVKRFIENANVDLSIANICPILPDEITYAPKFRTVNVHPAKLPLHRGSLPTLWSLKNGETESAVTYMLINARIDEGEILAQHTFPIHETDNAITIEKKIDEVIKNTLVNSLFDYMEGRLVPVKQDHSLATTTGKYFQYMRIDWQKEGAQEINNKIMYYPYLKPLHSCYTFFNNKKIAIKKASILPNPGIVPHLKNGEFIIKNLNVIVKVKDGAISIPLFKGIGTLDSLMLLYNKFISFKAHKYLPYAFAIE